MEPTRILIANDEPNARLVLKAALELCGYAVELAIDGADALTRIERSTPHLMVLDLRMPGIDGIGVLERMQQWPVERRLRTIVLSAHGSVPLAVRAIRLGASDFLEKPVTPQDLRLSVAAVLEEAMPSASMASRVDHGDDSNCSAAELLERIRRDLAAGRLEHAEELIMRGAELANSAHPHERAAYLNLLGVMHEAEGRLVVARAFYRRAIAADRDYKPPQDNAWRIYDLLLEAHTPIPLALGDPTELAHLAARGH